MCVLSEHKPAALPSPSAAAVPRERAVNLGKVARGEEEASEAKLEFGGYQKAGFLLQMTDVN